MPAPPLGSDPAIVRAVLTADTKHHRRAKILRNVAIPNSLKALERALQRGLHGNNLISGHFSSGQIEKSADALAGHGAGFLHFRIHGFQEGGSQRAGGRDDLSEFSA